MRDFVDGFICNANFFSYDVEFGRIIVNSGAKIDFNVCVGVQITCNQWGKNLTFSMKWIEGEICDVH